MQDIIDIFEERGFIEQITDREGLKRLAEGTITCYIGFDPTAKSLHVGNLIPIMALSHMQRQGHRPIVVMGGGTALVGDPSGKTEARPIMSREEIEENAERLKVQFSKFLDFSEGRAIMVNNADWLVELKYIDFLREIGRHFSVNRMLSAESYKIRLKAGLSFIEFNYMLLQAYDFWYLFKHYNCRLQMGGNDQWGNIVAGIELTRRLEGETIYGLTFPLITTSSGMKMGKTHKGAVWLEPELTSPYEYYQYWINQDDRDVERFLALFTFLPMDEVRRLGALKDEAIREAKEILAYEATKICHGEEEAKKAREASKILFSKSPLKEAPDTIPTILFPYREIEDGIPAYILFHRAGLCSSRSEARRLIGQGGGYINNKGIESFDQIIDLGYLKDDYILLKAGKKRFVKVKIKRDT
ncbi:MAG TPA: tyrosine--tRNA ligase [Desulfobacteraceae bacterium]|nr:tyrosine--tRNA ligase [Desulfobacteraceae bacterium]